MEKRDFAAFHMHDRSFYLVIINDFMQLQLISLSMIADDTTRLGKGKNLKSFWVFYEC